MQTVVLFIHLAVCVCLIGLVLLQRSEGGALGMGGGGGALMSGRGAADALARMTSIAGGIFLATSLGLTFISGAAAGDSRSVLDLIPRTQQIVPAPVAPAEPLRSDPTESTAPQAAETQLASMSVAPVVTAAAAPVTVAPAPVTASTRAAPLTARPAAVTSAPAPNVARAQPVSAQRPPATPPATLRTAPSVQRSSAIAVPAATRAAPPVHRPLILPNTSGAGTGQPLTAPAPNLPESVEVGNGVEAVRRERAGPDQ